MCIVLQRVSRVVQIKRVLFKQDEQDAVQHHYLPNILYGSIIIILDI